MSVTFEIENGREYVRANCPEKIRVDHFPADEYEPATNYENFPYELNITNGSAWTILTAMGLPAGESDLFGECDADRIVSALAGLVLIGESARLTEDTDREQRHISELLAISLEAQRRGQNVTWA